MPASSASVRARRRRLSFALSLLLLTVSGGVMPAPRDASAEPDADLQKKIVAAIERGAKWLTAQRTSDGLFETLIVKDNPGYQVGVTGLCSLALLASGASKQDPAMAKSLEAALKLDATAAGTGSRRTYDTGILLMFLTEMFRPEMKADKEKDRYAKPRVKDPCGLSKDAAQHVQDLASWLISVQLAEGWWRYPAYPPGDLSNAQYALLGLRAARECGAVVPLDAFMKALEFTLAQQQQEGPKVKRIIKGSGKAGDKDYVVDGGDQARGWKYQPDAGPISGSMTTAGVAVLAICRDALSRPTKYGSYTDALDRRTSRAVQDGFAWLDKNWAIDRNPPGDDGWHFYYLYGLERACTFAGRDDVGIHDWYVEGARHLLSRQQADGRWSTGSLGPKDILSSDQVDTAWALLFLKKATRPTAPIPAPVVTSGR